MSNRKIIITKAVLVLLTSVGCLAFIAPHVSANSKRPSVVINQLIHKKVAMNHRGKAAQVKGHQPAQAKKITHQTKIQKGKKVTPKSKSTVKRSHKKVRLEKKSNQAKRAHKITKNKHKKTSPKVLKKRAKKAPKRSLKKKGKKRSQRVIRKKGKKAPKKTLKRSRKRRPAKNKNTKQPKKVLKRHKRINHKRRPRRALNNLARTVHKWIKNTRWPAMRLFMKLKNNTGQALSITPNGHYLFLNQTDDARNGWGHVVRINTQNHHVSHGPRVWFGHGQSATFDSDNNMLVYLARTKNTVDDFAGKLAHHITVRFVNPWTLKETHHYNVNLHHQVLGDTLAYYDDGQFLNTRYKNHRHHTKMVNYLGSSSNHRIHFHRIQSFVSTNYRFNEGSAYNPANGRLYTVYNKPNYLLSVNAQDLINGQVKPKQIYRSNLGHPELEPEGLAFDDNGYGYLSITNYDRQHPHDWIYKTKQPVND